MSPVVNKRGFRAMRIPCGIIWRCKIDEFLTKVYFCICKNFTILNLELGADLGRSRVVLIGNSFQDIWI